MSGWKRTFSNATALHWLVRLELTLCIPFESPVKSNFGTLLLLTLPRPSLTLKSVICTIWASNGRSDHGIVARIQLPGCVRGQAIWIALKKQEWADVSGSRHTDKCSVGQQRLTITNFYFPCQFDDHFDRGKKEAPPVAGLEATSANFRQIFKKEEKKSKLAGQPSATRVALPGPVGPACKPKWPYGIFFPSCQQCLNLLLSSI